MIDFEKELARILESDPLGLLDAPPERPKAVTADERLVASFAEINEFVREYGHAPTQSRDISERRLFSRLKGLRDSPEKAALLLEYDEFELLADTPAVAPPPSNMAGIETVDDLLNADALGLLEGGTEQQADPLDIFTLKHVPKPQSQPDHVAKREPCKEFETFEPIFNQANADLRSGAKVTVPFRSERQIAPERLFVLHGMMVYVGGRGKWEKRNYGNVNARLYCVFDNGTESNMLLRSLAAALWKDENSRQIVPADQRELFEAPVQLSSEDTATGYIYVLRSLSEDPKIKEVENLYKIGFSNVKVDARIAGAVREPTYLMADVAKVMEFETYNLNPQKLEQLLHTFFAKACLNFDVFDGEGRRYAPREWFVVPLHVIETAIELLISGEIVNYRYDDENEQIVSK